MEHIFFAHYYVFFKDISITDSSDQLETSEDEEDSQHWQVTKLVKETRAYETMNWCSDVQYTVFKTNKQKI